MYSLCLKLTFSHKEGELFGGISTNRIIRHSSPEFLKKIFICSCCVHLLLVYRENRGVLIFSCHRAKTDLERILPFCMRKIDNGAGSVLPFEVATIEKFHS